MWAVEIDEFLAQRLRAGALGTSSRFHLIYGDILRVWICRTYCPNVKMKLAGNLPYNIATEVLFRIFDWREHFSSLVLMVQKEVADRIASCSS